MVLAQTNFNSGGSNYQQNKYLYNSKELQNDGFGGVSLDWYDYGARMYDPALGRFHTQDRFAEKYFDFTPYQYGANNPIKFIDVNGDSIWISHRKEKILYESGNLYTVGSDGKKTAYSGKGLKKDGSLKGFLGKTVNALGDISSSSAIGDGLVSDLQFSENNFTIKRGASNSFRADNSSKAAANLGEFSKDFANASKSGSGGTIFFNPNLKNGGFDVNGNTSRPPFVSLAHEMFHASDANFGMLYPTNDYNSPMTGTDYKSTFNGVLKAEYSAVYQENQLRNQIGLPLRQHYGINQGQPSGPRLVPFFLQNATYLYK